MSIEKKHRTTTALVLGIGLVVSACTSSTADTTTTTERRADTTTTSIVSTTTTTLDPFLTEPLPVDPDVRVGQLDSGLTYYIKRNDSPGGRLELRLMVDAGSVQEDDDQAGIAHFLEHMMFNGTERFPRNELISVLESFGPRFGPDINAYTSFDETVYELSISTADPNLVELGFEVLSQWADSATLAETDVVEERGVVLDEWRLRDLGFSARVSQVFQELVLPGTAYEDRLPIGDAESIQATSPELLSRFYNDWYRPDLMAVAVVGDIDVGEMEDKVVQWFGGLSAEDSPRVFEPVTYTQPSQVRAAGFQDEEAAQGSVTILWPAVAGPVETAGDLRSAAATSMAIEMLANRLNDDALRGDSVLLGASSVGFNLARPIDLTGIDVTAPPDDLVTALDSALIEIKRIREFGFNDTEVNRVLARFEAASTQAHERKDSIQDAQIAGRIVAHHLSGGHLMSPDQIFEVETRVLDSLDRAALETAFRRITDVAPAILAIGPDEAEVPDQETILEALAKVETMTVSERDDAVPDILSLMATPDPVEPQTIEVDDRFGYSTLSFENGATVFLWESDIAADGVYLAAESFGGTSVIDIEDLPEAYVMTDIISRSGIGPADVPTLERLLTSRLVEVFPWVGETREGLSGGAAAKDVEVLFQMVHLYVTAPRFDEVAVQAVLSEVASVNAARDDIPDLVAEEALIRGYYGDDPRYFAFPSVEQMADFDVDVAEEVYLERFGNAGDFAFAFVGDFDVAEMTELASRYIGTLPSTGERERYVDNQPLPDRRVQVEVVEAGADPQGFLSMYFTNPHDPDLEDRVTARLMDLIVNTRLRDRIREEMSATYSVFAGTDLQRDPDPFAESFVRATGAPEDLPRISEAVIEVISDLQTEGPTDEEFDTAVAQLRDDMDLIDNPTLAAALLTSYLYPDQPVTELADRFSVLEDITPTDIRDLARVAFNTDQRIEIQLVPRS